jgi:hypothetical protein
LRWRIADVSHRHLMITEQEWLAFIDDLQQTLDKFGVPKRIYGGSDYAVTADGGDYTVHLVVGIDPEGRMYLLDRRRKQSSSDKWIEAFCDLVLEWKPVGWAEEKGQISVGVGPALDKR